MTKLRIKYRGCQEQSFIHFYMLTAIVIKIVSRYSTVNMGYDESLQWLHAPKSRVNWRILKGLRETGKKPHTK